MGGVGLGASNLHEPGTVRFLLDMALAGGWVPGERREAKVDGWTFLEAAVAARG
ncbi:hypothetical protein [Streptomyces sp. NBC_00555]|uniref:hypothetical protein n=1 Tax=Streptomyces sp. NBC_00555 TaxID=2903662 RepID=UPI002B1D0083|nr:hypothetical protein [Streptomyces sp. NBC_00555]